MPPVDASRKMFEGRRFPVVLASSRPTDDLGDWLQSCADEIEPLLLDSGALLFRGFHVTSVADFDRSISALAYPRMDYVYGSTPRTAVADRIFTATEYPAASEIPLHNECAYQRRWPLKIAFCCLIPATTGGDTPLADLSRVTAALGAAFVEEFAERGVQYIRHYRPGFDVTWQQVFRTSERSVAERICAEDSISFEWLEADTLRTAQTCQGAAAHPRTGEQMFFNQAHLFHISSLGPQAASAMQKVFGLDRLPRHALFGDGGAIPDEKLDVIRAAFARETVSFAWQPGDVLLLDNMQIAHGRRSFTGPRRVLAALMQTHSRDHRVGNPISQ